MIPITEKKFRLYVPGIAVYIQTFEYNLDIL